ncbi:exopolysaccharide biosynthesis polyprenyl glycosylphosphotransferase [Mycolicibacterium psychrotolerans]|nr:exopolysaccharide biosynthesis polyprenyl glycosylphosphotransferase [Mycolicibacterium psychrotolerans]
MAVAPGVGVPVQVAPAVPATVSVADIIPLVSEVARSSPAPFTRRRLIARQMSVGPDVVSLVMEVSAIASVFLLLDLPGHVLSALLVVGCLAAGGAYRHRLTLSVLVAAPRICCAATIGAVLGGVLADKPAGVVDLSVAATVACAAVLVARFASYALQRRLRRQGVLRRRTVIVGGGSVTSCLLERMHSERESGLDPVMVLDDDPVTRATLTGQTLVRPLRGDLRDVLKSSDLDTAIIGPSAVGDATLLRFVRDCDEVGCQVLVVPRLWESWSLIGDMDRIGAIPVCHLRGSQTRRFTWRVKLLVERSLAALALIVLLPLLVVVALAVYRSDPSAPVLFRQTRVGLGGHEFELLKFRSMKPAGDTESLTKWTIKGDPRIGRLGRFLRASSLDELPQLWNIVRGEMVLVGPRPERPHFVEEFDAQIPGYKERHRVPVGLTGWAAINGFRGDTSIAERVRYDNFYISNWSLWLDVSIVIRTAWAVLSRRGG